MRRVLLFAILGLAGCGDADTFGPSKGEVEQVARQAFLSQTYSNSFRGANPMPCASHFEVLGVDVVDRRAGEPGGTEFATLVVRLHGRAKTEFPYEYSCSWSTQSDTGTRGFWQPGETRDLTRTLDFVRRESGWRLSN